MTISERLVESLDLLNKFEQAINIPKNNDNISNFIEKITIDLKKYNLMDNFDKNELNNQDNKIKIKEIINKIDNLNKIILPKSKLADNFVESNSIS